jgi:hypothetical protein
MDVGFYSESAIQEFVHGNLCQDDKKLYNHYLNDDVANFRERIHRKYPTTADARIEQIVYACVTDTIRDIVLKIIGELTEEMRAYGDLIVTGGEAFNMYFEKSSRIITSDIDTKFIPVFKGKSGRLISSASPKYFGMLQSVKVKMWHHLGEIARTYNEKIKNRLEKDLKGTKISRMLGISFPSNGPWVTRRYTLIQKKRQEQNKNNVAIGDVLIDVELFALDLKIKFFSVEKNRVIETNLGGILDIAIMRPHEIGYEVAFTRHHGILYQNKDSGKMVHDKRIMYAGKRFLVEDVYLMQVLGLRPKKATKDRKRMFTFAKEVLKLKTIRKGDPIVTIFRKSIKHLNETQKIKITQRPVFKLNHSTYDPYKNEKYTTKPRLERLASQQLVGLKGPNTLTLQNFQKTSGPFKFNIAKKKWIVSKDPYYIKNEYTFRPTKIGKVPMLHMKNILYGYKPNRNWWMPNNLITKSATIPLVGLKNTSFVYKNELRKA